MTEPTAESFLPTLAAGPARFYMTSDLRALTGLTRTHLDYYLREGLLIPADRTESGYLLFDDAELALLRDIVRARQAGESLRSIRARIGR
jgi:MerR family Zn(II)-responsive transcriptional regulator of zntA